MKKVSLLLMIILLVLSQLSLGYQSANAISNSENNESNSESISSKEDLMPPKNGDDGIVQPNDNDGDNISNSGLEDDEASTIMEDENTSLNDEEMTDVPKIGNDFGIVNRGNGVAIVDYYGEKKDVVIPDQINGESVVEIGNKAFYNKTIKSVTIPSSVTTIGSGAFMSNQLTSVIIPPKVTTIEEDVFSFNKLESIDIHENVTIIEAFAFAANELTSVAIPPKVTTIAEGTFSGNKLENVAIHENVTTIEKAAFYNNKLKSVEIPPSVTKIGGYAFIFNQLESVEISPNVTEVEEFIFYENKLTSVKIPSKVTSIGDYAFYDNKITSVKIPSNVTSLGESAFNKNQLTNVEIPSSVTTIGKRAFRSNPLEVVNFNGEHKFQWDKEEYPFAPYKVGEKYFLGWYEDKDHTRRWNYSVTKPMTIYAKWRMFVKFDTNGGSEVPTQPVVYGELTEAPTTPVKEGYTFEGWYKDNDLTEVWNFNQDVVKKDITLYAKWSKVSYIVTFDTNGGSTVSSQAVGYNELVKAPSAPNKEGYTFGGWHKDKELTIPWDFAKDVVIKNVTLYAKWTKDNTSGGGSGGSGGGSSNYQVIFDSNGGSKVPSQAVGYNGLLKVPTTPVKDGYEFVGWHKDAELKNAWDFAKDKVTADITLYGKWKKDVISEVDYMVTFDSNGGSKIPSQTIAYKALVKAPSNPTKEGYLFIGWYKDEELTIQWDFAKDVVIKNVTLYAKWTKDNTSGGGSGGSGGGSSNYQVIFDSNGGSKVPSQTVGYNDLLKVPTTPEKDGYEFVGWHKDAELKNAWDFAKDKVTADITLYGKWKKDDVSEVDYMVTFDSNGGSKIPSQTIAYKALVNAPSNPTKEGYLFIGWYKDEKFTNAWDFAKDVVTKNLTLYARWMKERHGCDITFEDIDQNWAQDMIKEVAERCIIKGYPDGTFRPNDMIQRQHVVLMIDRALQPASIREAESFSDVPKNYIYYEQITRLQQAGIVDGSNGIFRPKAYITRAQMAKMVVLAFGLTPEGNSTFKDVDSSHWASGYIAALADHNIALGDENGNFRPNDNLTRAQFIAIMYRALSL